MKLIEFFEQQNFDFAGEVMQSGRDDLAVIENQQIRGIHKV